MQHSSTWNAFKWPLLVQFYYIPKNSKNIIQSLQATNSSGSYLENKNMFKQYACINTYARPNTTIYGFLLALLRNTKAYLDYIRYKDI